MVEKIPRGDSTVLGRNLETQPLKDPIHVGLCRKIQGFAEEYDDEAALE